MNVDRFNNWLQTLAALGVIAGLGLVAYELRQQHELVRAQLASDTFTAFREVARSLQNESNAAAYTKSLSAPDSLTPVEQVILDGLFVEIINVHLQRPEYYVSRGFFQIDADVIGSPGASLIFAGEYGRTWWIENRMAFPPHIQEMMDSHAARVDELPFFRSATRIREEAQQ